MEKHCEENAERGVNREEVPFHLSDLRLGSALPAVDGKSYLEATPSSTVSQSQKSESAQWNEQRLGRERPTHAVSE